MDVVDPGGQERGNWMSDDNDSIHRIELFGGPFDGRVLEFNEFKTSIILPVIQIKFEKDGSVSPMDKQGGSSVCNAKYWLAVIDETPVYLSNDLRATDHFPWKADEDR